jgi:hypothetical protein
MMCLQVEQTKSRLKQENYDTILWYNLPGDNSTLPRYKDTILWYNLPGDDPMLTMYQDTIPWYNLFR